MSQVTAVGGLVDSAGLGLGPLGVGALRAGLSCVPLGREELCGLVYVMGSLNCTISLVFLMPQGVEVPCGWDSRGSLM